MKRFREFILENELDDLRRDILAMGFPIVSAKLEAKSMYENVDQKSYRYRGESIGYGGSKEESLKNAFLSLFMGLEDSEREIRMTKDNMVDRDINENYLREIIEQGKDRILLSRVTDDYDLTGVPVVTFSEEPVDPDLLGTSYLTFIEVE
jgi:hypothetical protein